MSKHILGRHCLRPSGALVIFVLGSTAQIAAALAQPSPQGPGKSESIAGPTPVGPGVEHRSPGARVEDRGQSSMTTSSHTLHGDSSHTSQGDRNTGVERKAGAMVGQGVERRGN